MPAPDDKVAGLLAQAFERCRGTEVNTHLERLRERIATESGRAFSYEVTLRGTGLPGIPATAREWGYFRDVVAPRLGYHVRGMKLRVTACPGVFLTIFDGEDVYFVNAGDFFRHYKAVEGLSDIEFARRAVAWENEGGKDP